MIIKTLILTCVLFFSSLLQAQEDCKCESNEATHNKLAKTMALIALKSSDDKVVILEAATTYLAALGNGVNFKEEDAQLFISKLQPLCEDISLDKKFRSLTCTRMSGTYGKLTQKNKLNGISTGKSAFKYLKLALKLDNTNLDAIFGHAVTIVELNGQGYFIKKIIETNLGASFADEAKFAKANLERVKLDHHPLYASVLEIN